MSFLQALEADTKKKSDKPPQLFAKKKPTDKKTPVVLELNLTEKYQRHLDKKNMGAGRQPHSIEEEKINVSDIGCRVSSQGSPSNTSFDDMLRPPYDMSLSIK